jgi:hypothetical protein
MPGTVVGIFKRRDQAERAVAALQQVGVAGDQVGLAVCSGEVTVQRNALAMANVVDRGLFAVLRGMGIKEEAARGYERHFEAWRTVVTVAAGDRAREVAAILRRHGAAKGRERDGRRFEDVPTPGEARHS